jgi:hypothetical protein
MRAMIFNLKLNPSKPVGIGEVTPTNFGLVGFGKLSAITMAEYFWAEAADCGSEHVLFNTLCSLGC